MTNPAVSIIIPNFNGKPLLKTCLDSISSQDFSDYQVIVVDNGSTDGSLAYLEDHYPDVITIPLTSNRGFSTAVNMGIRRSCGPYILLLNNDTELDPVFLSEMVKAFELNQGVDFCAPKMLNYYQRKVLDGAGDGFLRGGIGYRIGTLEKDSDFFDTPRLVFGACAGAAMYRRRVFERVGLFDEDFFAYLEDVDMNIRAARLKLTCLYAPAARIFHIGSATAGNKFNAFTVHLTSKNMLNILAKNFTIPELLFSFPRILIHLAVWILILIKRGQIKAFCRGFYLAMMDFPKMWSKRRVILASDHQAYDIAFLRRVALAEKEVIQSILRRRICHGKTVWPIQMYLNLFYRT